MQRYLIAESFMGGGRKEISKQKFDLILQHRKTLRALFDIEEVFDLFANSFLEFESHLIGSTIEYSYRFPYDLESRDFFSRIRSGINLRLVSLLTSSRAYEEHAYRRLADLAKYWPKYRFDR